MRCARCWARTAASIRVAPSTRAERSSATARSRVCHWPHAASRAATLITRAATTRFPDTPAARHLPTLRRAFVHGYPTLHPLRDFLLICALPLGALAGGAASADSPAGRDQVEKRSR